MADINTSKRKLDMAVRGQSVAVTVDDAKAGCKRLVAHLCRTAVTRVGIEATGGYERDVA